MHDATAWGLDFSTPKCPRPPGRNSRFHSPDWRYAALSLDAQVGVRTDPPSLEAI